MNLPTAFAAAGCLAALLLAPALSLVQADYAREKRCANEITPGIVVGSGVVRASSQDAASCRS